MSKLCLKIDQKTLEASLAESAEDSSEALELIKNAALTDYKDLLDLIKNEREEKIEKEYCCYILSEYFILLKRRLNFPLRFLAAYKIENKEIKNMIKKIFVISENKYSSIYLCKENKFNFLVMPSILKLFFIDADLRGRGEKVFRKFKKKKKSGKLRTIIAPHPEIIPALREVNYILQKTYDNRNLDFQVAYKKGKSIANNTSIHKEKKYIMTSDLKDFFPSCKRELVDKYIKFLFKNSLNQEVVKNYFLDIILDNDGLFIGNPVSGTIANAILSPAVKYMQNICHNFDVEFSVYADDMTFSSDKFLTVDFVKNIFNLAFTTYGLDGYFNLNEEKFHGYSGTNRRSVGLGINPDNKITIPNSKFSKIRVRLHHLHYGIKEKGGDLQELAGLISYATAYDESGKVYRLLKKYEDTVKKYKLCSDKTLEKLKEVTENA